MRRAAFLDRDGTLNERPPPHHYVVEERGFAWLDGARDAVARLSRAGFVVAVVSNQRGVARGLVDRSVLSAIEGKIQNDLAGYGTQIERFRYCLHDGDSCDCRKPRPGMLIELAAELDVDLAASWMIGDAESDVLAGKAAGCRTALVGSAATDVNPDVVASSLDEASRVIVAMIQSDEVEPDSNSLTSAV